MHTIRFRQPDSASANDTAETTAAVYNRAGHAYIAYADGDPQRPFSFDGLHAYADRYLWSLLEAKLAELRADGAFSVRILDAGCGPGTWLRRLVTCAKALGFTSITARGFDIAETQVQAARLMSRDVATLPGVHLTFDVADIGDPLPEADASVDITLCLYSVLSHLPTGTLPGVAAEFARVTAGHFVTTVRSIGSMPTIFVDSIEKARHFRYDHDRSQCEIELSDGRRFCVGFHLFGADELRGCFAGRFGIEDLCGLDLFHSRFASDPRWNPASLPVGRQFAEQLAKLEDAYARDPAFMEHATHLLLVGRSLHVEKVTTRIPVAMPAQEPVSVHQ